MLLPTRRITKIAIACKIYTITANLLADILFTEHINTTPISVGSGDAITTLAKIKSKYLLNEQGIH